MDMKKVDFIKIKKKLEKELDSKRYDHTLGVAYTAAALAMRYDVSLEDAMLAGLLHDCGKCLSGEKRLDICKKNNIYISETERKNTSLLHAKVGAFLAMTEYGVEDVNVLNAITNHTTGRPGMSLLEKIIFIADYIEPGRKEAPHLEALRKTAFWDLDEALRGILADTLAYLETKEETIDTQTFNTYQYYMNENRED